MMRWIGCLVLLALLVVPILAQEPERTPEPTPAFTDALNTEIVDAYFLINNATPLLGEPVEIELAIAIPEDAELSEPWPELVSDDTLEILSASEIQVSEEGERTIHKQTYVAVLWELGEYLSSESFVTAIIDDELKTVPIRSFFAFVPGLITDQQAASLRPSLPPVDMGFIPNWVYWVLAGATGLGTILLARIIQRSKQDVTRVIVGSPTQVAIAQLEDLRLQGLSAETIYPLVADSLRQYLQQRFGIDAVEMTTGEIDSVLSETDLLARRQISGLQQLLEQADLVKFARFQPDSSNGSRLISYAIRWLREVDREDMVKVDADD